jgi:hypothetical protein
MPPRMPPQAQGMFPKKLVKVIKYSVKESMRNRELYNLEFKL